jgi:hypothetical protein
MGTHLPGATGFHSDGTVLCASDIVVLVYPVRTCYLNSPVMDVDLGMGGLRRCSVLCLVGISRLTWRCSTPLRCLGGCNSYRIASSFNAWAVASMFSLCSRWSCTLLAYATGWSSYRVSTVLQSCVVAALFSRCPKVCCDDYSRGICVENLQWRPSWVSGSESEKVLLRWLYVLIWSYILSQHVQISIFVN